MANRKITDLTALVDPATDDVLPIVDVSEGLNANKNKKITYVELFKSIDNGTATAPAIAFNASANTGIYRSAANELSIATGGGQAIKIESNNKTTIYGDLVVTGSQTTISSTTIDVADKNIQLATGNSSDAGADGGGLTLKGATDKTWNWVDSTDAWTANQHIDITTGKVFKIAGTQVLNATTLGSGIVNSSLTSVGTLGSLTVTNAVTAGSLDISGGADIDGTLEADAYTVNGTALNEYIADTVGAMVSSNTETNITVTYDDSDNTLDFVIGTLNQNTTGNAATATALETARTIGGVSFNGTANINLPGVNQTGNQNTTGSAATLTTARTIGGVSFDGSANINLPGVNAAGNQNTSGTAAGLSGTPTITVNDVVAASLDISGNADIDGILEADAYTVAGTALNEYIADTVGAMVSSNTETNITVTYDDADNTLDFVIGTLNQNTTGNAATATALQTARTIGGVSFDGTGNITLPGVNATGNQNTTGSAATLTTARTIGGVSFNGSANIDLPGVNTAGNQNTSGTSAGLAGTPNITVGDVVAASLDISGNVDVDGTLETDGLTINGTSLSETIADTVGAMVSSNTETGITVTYDDADNTLDFVVGTLNQNTTGNAATATALQNARTINGVSFDGTGNITIADSTKLPLAGGTLTGQVNFDNGTNAGRDIQWQPNNDRLAFFDNTKATFGDGVDLQIYHSNDNNSYIHESGSGHLVIKADDLYIQNAAGSQTNIHSSSGGAVELSHAGTKKFETTANGVTITGDLLVTDDITIADDLFMGDGDIIRMGDGEDLQIYHTGSESIVRNTTATHLYIQNSGGNIDVQAEDHIYLKNYDGQTYARFLEDGASELYYDDSKKLETTTNGVTITGGIIAGGLTYPTSDGSNGQVLKTNGSGTLSWTTPISAGSDLTGSSLASNIVSSSLTSVGTLTGLTTSGNILMTGTGCIDVAAGTTAQRPGSPNAGMFRYNTTLSKFEGHDGSAWGEIGGGGGGASFYINTLSSSSGTGGGSATFNGTAYRFQISNAPATGNAAQMLVSVGGVIQKANSGTSQPSEGYAIDGNDIIFGAAPASAASWFIITYGALNAGEPTDNTVSEAKLQVSNSPTNGYFLSAQSGNTGGLTWAAVDLSSKLSLTGGTLTGQVDFDNGSNAGRDIQWQPASDRLAFFDNTKATFGDGVDLQIYHNGSDSYIKDSGTGSLKIGSSAIWLQAADYSETMASFTPNGAVELFYDNSKKFETLSNGVRVTGQVDVNGGGISLEDSRQLLLGTDDDAYIMHNGSHQYNRCSTGYYHIQAQEIRFNKADGNETLLKAISDGAVELYHNNVKKLETTSTGLNITGVVVDDGATHDGDMSLNGASYNSWWDKSDNAFKFDDNAKAKFGTSGDLGIFHDGNNSQIREEGTGNLMLISNNEIRFEKASPGEAIASFNVDGACELYHDNSKKFETTSAGVEIDGKLTFAGDGHTKGIELGADADILLYHDNSNAYFENNVGDFYIRNDGNSTSEKIRIQAKGGEQSIVATPNGNVELYFDNSKKFSTNSNGCSTHGNHYFDDNQKILLGSGSDFEIYHDGTNSIQFFDAQVGAVKFRTDVGNSARNNIVLGQGVELYHLNSKKLETLSDGVLITGQCRTTADFSVYDNVKFKAGSSSDLQIYHDGTNSHLKNSTGYFLIQNNGGSPLALQAVVGEESIVCDANGAVKLYYDNVKHFETTSIGCKISDNDTTSVLQFANSAGDNGYVMGESTNIIGFKDNNPDWLVRGIKDGTVELYYDGTKKFQTRTGGAYVYGKGGGTTFTAAQAMHADDRCGLEVQGELTGIKIASTYNDNTHPEYGLVFVQGPSTSSYNCWSISPDGPSKGNGLNFHYGAQSGNIHVASNCKVYMTGSGDWVPYTNNASDLGTSSKRWRNIYTTDLHLSNEGKTNKVDGTWGDWTLQEGEEDVFMINNRSGKKYKMALQEVS